jgi:hypothetical protein
VYPPLQTIYNTSYTRHHSAFSPIWFTET